MCKGIFFHKINKGMQRKPGVTYFVHSQYDAINVETQFNHPKLYNFMNS